MAADQSMAEPSVNLFSYGTLQDPAVQVANFGRRLEGTADALPGYATTMVEITDPVVLAQSGKTHHPIVAPTGRPMDEVAGMVFRITPNELAAADKYEVDDYARVEVTLRSGTAAWVYVDVREVRPVEPAPSPAVRRPAPTSASEARRNRH